MAVGIASLRGSRAAGSAPLLVIVAAFSVQAGAAFATKLFDDAGPLGAVWLRTVFAALVLSLLAGRSLRLPRPGMRLRVAAFGITLAAMNACFYEAIDRVSLGVAVTAEFVGPLAVAVAGSRRRQELVWVALAGAGVALLGSPTVHVDRVGVGFALAAGGCWALYIVLAKSIAEGGPVLGGLAVALGFSTVLLAPFGIYDAGDALLDPAVLGVGLGVAMLSSAIPYVLEFVALRLVRASTFGILLSLEPAVAALVGAVVLSQGLHALEAVAIVLVVSASVGANRNVREPVQLPPEP